MVLRGLDAKEIGKITVHLTKLKKVNRAVVEQVIKEASEIVNRGDVHVGGEEFVKKMLSRGLGEDGAIKMLEMASKDGPLDSLRWVDTKTLVNFLVSEHPQTIALIICLLEPLQAAEVLSALPEAVKSDVAMRIATIERILENAIEEIKEVLKGQLDIGAGKGAKLGGVKTIAEILNQCDRSTEQTVLGKIEEQNGAVADSIRQLMFVFDDLVKVDDRGIQMVLKETSAEELTLALKTASEALKEKIFKNMSQRAAQILKEDMQTRGPVKVSDVMPDIVDAKHKEYASRFIETMALYKKFEDMINLGAYKEGSNPKVDHAIKMIDTLKTYLRQGMNEQRDFAGSLEGLYEVFSKAEGAA